jgi:hypothetical protein
MSTPRSAAVELRWRPCLNFYEHGVPLLRHFDDEGFLRRFRVSEHEVEAYLFDGTHMKVGVTELSLAAPAGALDAVVTGPLVAQVLWMLKPADPQVIIYMQHLEPLDWSDGYEAACGRATAAWLPPLAAAAGFYDCAPLVDGVSPLHRLRYQIEFGVVDAPQAAMRLARQVGRSRGPQTGMIPPQEDLPGLGLFVDSEWFLQGAPPGADELTTWLMLMFRQVEEDAAKLASLLYEECARAAVSSGGGETR